MPVFYFIFQHIAEWGRRQPPHDDELEPDDDYELQYKPEHAIGRELSRRLDSFNANAHQR